MSEHVLGDIIQKCYPGNPVAIVRDLLEREFRLRRRGFRV